jgi:uncharacterized membrane protein
MCHSEEPFYEGMLWAPKGVKLDNELRIATAARDIYLQAGITHAMPPGNRTFIEPEERAKIVEWYRKAAPSLW